MEWRALQQAVDDRRFRGPLPSHTLLSSRARSLRSVYLEIGIAVPSVVDRNREPRPKRLSDADLRRETALLDDAQVKVAKVLRDRLATLRKTQKQLERLERTLSGAASPSHERGRSRSRSRSRSPSRR